MSSGSETEQRIREAAFRALVEHGYADLSLTDIGEELGQNPSIIYHYFDSKDDLLLSMLDGFVDIFVDRQTDAPIADAEAALRGIIDQMLHPEPERVSEVISSPPEDVETAIARVFVELWAHSIWDPDFRAATTAVEGNVRDVLALTIQSGIERDQFRPVDPERTADHLFFLLKQGLHTRATTNRDAPIDRVHALTNDIVDDLVDDPSGA
ncbi:TetR/AcrR family transcriptional regulator [Halosimplex sp. J119]